MKDSLKGGAWAVCRFKGYIWKYLKDQDFLHFTRYILLNPRNDV